MKATILVLTNRTAVTDDFVAALSERSARRAERYELIVPPEGSDSAAQLDAQHRLDRGLNALREAGLDATGAVADDGDAFAAVVEAYDASHHDEILVMTLPAATSQWLRIDLPTRVARATGALVSHVVAQEIRAAPIATHLQPHRGPGALAPLQSLGWGRRAVRR